MTEDSVARSNSGSVRALARGLAILHHVNKTGEARPGEIAKALGIPRPTVYRLLETLEELGYLAFSATSNYVRVTRFAAALGDGYTLTSEIAQAAGPIFAAYSKQLVWPLDLTVYHNAAMVIQETTHGRSPLSIDRGMTGFRLPMLRSSAGRAYLSACPEEERGLILEHLRRLNDPEDLPFLEDRLLTHLLDETRARGIAVRDSGEFRQETASIAVPIKADGTVLGCVSLIWIRSAMSTRRALDDFGAPLLEIAQRISGALPA
ncbi:DNA-binding transcriptional regulator [Lutimaribacter sp. EGI FJ00015]|uniref:DNA-binding transcriptional regulator n=1 Tax=Lutimaribacter degradans TaxID=2945989 RepID=A0ACC5ZU70_9RHOB|nr:DNA-binding transcriptional regulator [Lutimaribacter sp. EGI FJ00013]MCM2561675.1 DNA-binding transcriptional regulator [Lutimaribacter sp. EGI FJ00013]MCO0612612.1 DNA-binding transcriptional regulator [Lutimaribacter sp. EGI FJ00015]MCO0635271.1 DNA-binding transcriptional regulator [Lutimaribacter sp. EGI FJ00014]